MKAIKETGNQLVAAVDPSDSVGIIDSYFPEAAFFTEFERFDRHVDRRRRKGVSPVDYVSICSPNYLHDAHMRFALRSDCDAICEKPLVLNPWTLDSITEVEADTGKKVNCILQLRHHPSILEIKEKYGSSDDIIDIDLLYITSRGVWYDYSWKGDIEKSGGVATNIGIHFFDMLQWTFGPVKKNIVNLYESHKAGGYLELERARVRWFLSIDANDLPQSAVDAGMRTHRSITIGGEELEFSSGFTDLHTVTYQEILNGNGYGIETARPSIEIVHDIRNTKPIGLVGEYHPHLNNLR